MGRRTVLGVVILAALVAAVFAFGRLRQGGERAPVASPAAEEVFLVGWTPGASHAWTPVVSPRPGETVELDLVLSPSGPPVELVLGEPAWLDVVVVDPDGREIPWSNVRLEVPGRGPSFGFHAVDLHRMHACGEDGRVRFARPVDPFRLTAFGPGFARESFGPFGPGESEELTLQLAPGGCVRGVVTSGGAPVAGAMVAIQPTTEPGTVRPSWGVTKPEEPFLVARTVDVDAHDATTGPDGSFTVTVPDDGWYTLCVRADGHPIRVEGPFRWTASAAARVDVALVERGGAIEGRVLAAPGRDVEGLVVGASPGDSILHSTTVGADGRYRLEGLAPGRWQVRACEPPAVSLQEILCLALTIEGEPVPDCVVRSGETTQHDLDLTLEDGVVLEGALALDGWRATRVRLVTEYGAKVAAADGSGVAYRFVLSRPGPYWLEVHTPSGTFEKRVVLAAGRNELDVAAAAGSLVLEPWEQPWWIALSWRRDDGLRFAGRAHSASRGKAIASLGYAGGEAGRSATSTVRVPAGTVLVRRPPEGESPASGPWERAARRTARERWPVLAAVEVAPGEEVRVELSR